MKTQTNQSNIIRTTISNGMEYSLTIEKTSYPDPELSVTNMTLDYRSNCGNAITNRMESIQLHSKTQIYDLISILERAKEYVDDRN